MKDYKNWDNIAVVILETGIKPEGRTIRACRAFCLRNGHKYPGTRTIRENERLIRLIDEKFSTKGHQMKKTATKKSSTASVKDTKNATESVKDAKPVKKSNDERQYSFRTISIDKILNGDNVRAVNDISDLVASIEAHGIINPITVTPQEGMPSVFHVVAGFRRFAAAQKLGLDKVPCHVLEAGDETREISLSENVNRIGMTPYEECMAVKSLINKKNTALQVARKFGRTLRWVLVRKKLADAGDKVLKKVKEGSIELGAAAKIADLPDKVFKSELESCYSTDKYFIDGVLERYHKDLSKAPFEHEACLKCEKCSACQADLFENEPKAYCLDPACWARKAKKAAQDKVKKLQEEGRNARLGKFGSCGVSYDDEADDFEIGKYNTELQKTAKEAGIQKRVLVDAKTGKTFEYYDKRDLPDYHEETEEEREERENAEKTESRKNNVRGKLLRKKLQHAVAFACCDFKEESDKIATMLVFVADNNYDFFDDDSKQILGIDEKDENGYDRNVEEIPDSKTFHDVGDAVRKSIEQIAACISDIDTLKKLLKVLGENADEYTVTDKEVDAEIKRQDEEKAKKQAEEETEDEEDDE